MSAGQLVRTLRIRTRRKVGNLGRVTTALGDAGVAIGEIVTLRIGHNYTLRDFHLNLDDEEHLKQAIASIDAIPDSEVVEVVNEVETVHCGGKIRTVSKIDLSDMNALKTAYNPGVKEIIGRIDDDPSVADIYTAFRRTVGIISDGSGLLGVGRVKAQAMLPVLEAKAALLSAKAGLNGLPLALDLEKEDDLVDTVVRMSPSFGAVILDAIGSGRSLRVMQALSERLEIPVFDDDADGPAIAVLGALMNACTRIGRDLKEVKVGQVGLGAAGGSIARLVMHFTGNPVLGEDVHPAAMSRHVYQGGKQSSLEEIMRECDVVVANTGHADVIPASMVREGQAILALSMPNPEIDPYDATLAGAAFAADGQSIDKAVVFPGLLLGATAVRARTINDAMRVAAATKLAELAPDQDLLPSPLSETVHAQVAEAVADAAVRTGVADEVEASLRTAAVFTRVLNDEQQIPLARTCDGDS